MKTLFKISVVASIFLSSCMPQKEIAEKPPTITFEKIKYYAFPMAEEDKPIKSRLTYYDETGTPHRWMELDAENRMATDYIYEYDSEGEQTGARYREDGEAEFSIERVHYLNDSTKVTQWLDSLGKVYYTMIDDLNTDKKTKRASFTGENLHGFDSTFYTQEGFVKRIFFTNTKGKIFNDRQFVYDSINEKGDWLVRKKIMYDTVSEIQVREVYYDNRYTSANGKYYEGVISTGELAENVFNFTKDESVLFLTRTNDWTIQSGYMATKNKGLFTVTFPIPMLDSIYNGAISPDGNQLIYSIRNAQVLIIKILKKKANGWRHSINVTEQKGLQGGYFYWLNDTELYFYHDKNNGDLVQGRLQGERLIITDSLKELNTNSATEFSPYVDQEKRYIIFTRYEESNPANQGFFVSYNRGNLQQPQWSEPTKLNMLPYGWNARIINKGSQFLFTDGEDIYSMPSKMLKLALKQ
ncbi:MAG: hypothetical protein KJO73_00765 [Croceitalea sp.]|nr:hypothetical protein [Croceitalea sp.]